MKNQVAIRHGIHALTLIELLVVLVIISVLIALWLPSAFRVRPKTPEFQCASNLKQIGIAFRIWADDHGDSYPQALAGDANLSLLGNVKWPTASDPLVQSDSPSTYLVFAAMSNELNTPKVLVCPEDDRPSRTNFGNDFVGPTGGHNLGVSYFVGRDASDSNPQMFLTGDRNICADTTAAPIPNHGYGISPDGSGRGAGCAFTTNSSSLQHVGWSPVTMHKGTGNVGLADGSVQQFSTSGLIHGLVSASATNTNPAAQNYLLFP